jgi:hypothetical protein
VTKRKKKSKKREKKIPPPPGQHRPPPSLYKGCPVAAQILHHPAMALNGKFRESPTIQPEP